MDTKSQKEAFDAFAEDLLSETTPRLLVIVGSSKTENLLFEILSAYMLPKRTKNRQQDELLEGDRPLGTFSARIKICYRLGLISESLYQSLETLRDLRNSSAHSISFDINKSPVREYISELLKKISTRKSFNLTKERYFEAKPLSKFAELQCILLTICVLLEAIREKTTITTGNDVALRIANQ